MQMFQKIDDLEIDIAACELNIKQNNAKNVVRYNSEH